MERMTIPKQLNRKIGRAMHDFNMLSDGDKVIVAVSGGVDSLVASWVLKKWQAKAPIDYEIVAVYINNGFWTVETGGRCARSSNCNSDAADWSSFHHG